MHHTCHLVSLPRASWTRLKSLCTHINSYPFFYDIALPIFCPLRSWFLKDGRQTESLVSLSLTASFHLQTLSLSTGPLFSGCVAIRYPKKQLLAEPLSSPHFAAAVLLLTGRPSTLPTVRSTARAGKSSGWPLRLTDRKRRVSGA